MIFEFGHLLFLVTLVPFVEGFIPGWNIYDFFLCRHNAQTLIQMNNRDATNMNS
jgi:hypothetical protein